MYYSEMADMVLHWLFRCCKEGQEASDLLEIALEKSDWMRIHALCQQRHKQAVHEQLTQEAEYWEGVSETCLGAYHSAKEEWSSAERSFDSGAIMFGLATYTYSQGVALLAHGRVVQALGDRGKALYLYKRSQDLLERRPRSCDGTRKCKDQVCWELQALLRSLIDEVRHPPVVHLHPWVPYKPKHPLYVYSPVKAGEPIYSPAEMGDHTAGPTERIVWKEDKYKLLELRTRAACMLDLARSPDYFCVPAKGDSMTGDGIHDGDLLLVQKHTAPPTNGTITVLTSEKTGPLVKRFYRAGDRIYLQSANPAYAPLIFDATCTELRVVGLVKAIMEKIKED